MRLVTLPPLVQGCNTCRAYAEMITTALFRGAASTATAGRYGLADHLCEAHGIEPAPIPGYAVRSGDTVMDAEGDEWMLVRRAPWTLASPLTPQRAGRQA
ncbi:hypothetical protein AC230_22985 [Streptomyces caatingaensis]|uniref:Uncharacterized protein n=1 Tax=Streptomyces caatingaensis TaxID=1678637 RepID=A0A0K9XAK2_9ACTN|nr:hypothetical protein AC230_22985 [Streptomyces caatingaensis]